MRRRLDARPPRTGGRVPASGIVIGAMLALALGLASCGGSSAGNGAHDGPVAIISSVSGDGGPYAGIEIKPPYALPTATLTDTAGDALRLPGDLDGGVGVYFFGYTSCPDVCPLIMSNIALAVARLDDDVADQVQVVVVTSDPARDDPATLGAWLERYDPGLANPPFVGLTGDIATITNVADAMGVPIERGRRLSSGGYDVSHGAQVVGFVGDQGAVVWTADTSPEDMAGDLERLVAASRARAGTASSEAGR